MLKKNSHFVLYVISGDNLSKKRVAKKKKEIEGKRERVRGDDLSLTGFLVTRSAPSLK